MRIDRQTVEQTKRQTDKHIDSQTERQTLRWIAEQTEEQTGITRIIPFSFNALKIITDTSIIFYEKEVQTRISFVGTMSPARFAYRIHFGDCILMCR